MTGNSACPGARIHASSEVTGTRGVSLGASRLAFLEILIAAGWGDTPQDRIPADVIADAAMGREPRRCGALRVQGPRVRDEGRTAHGLVRVKRMFSTISRGVCDAT